VSDNTGASKTKLIRNAATKNVMTGRLARGFVNRVMRELGPINNVAPEFPLAAGGLAPLHAKAQA